MISRILYFLIIVFCINLAVVGLGIATIAETRLDSLTAFSGNPEDYYNLNTSQDIVLPDVGDPDSVLESPSMPEYLPEKTENYATLLAITNIADGLIFGWATILLLLSIPAILVYGILGVITLLQIFSLFYIIAYAIAAIRGRV